MSPARTLDMMDVGTSGRIVESGGSVRLSEMGLIPGETVTVLRHAPFGDPIEIRVLGYRLCLRRADAQSIGVELIP